MFFLKHGVEGKTIFSTDHLGQDHISYMQ